MHAMAVWSGAVMSTSRLPTTFLFRSSARSALILASRWSLRSCRKSSRLVPRILLIDLPVGPAAKVTTAMDAMRLRKLFEFVGDHFGISVEVVTTDGRQPIGSGIGPVLEAQDVMAVLANAPGAPTDLREKSLRLAAHVLEYDPDLRGGTGYARARELLESGAALKQMHKIIEAQGPSACRTDLGTSDRRYSALSGTASSTASTACGSIAWHAWPARRSTRAPASRSQEDRRPGREGRAALSHPRLRASEFELAVAAAHADPGYVLGVEWPREQAVNTSSHSCASDGH